MRNAFLAYRFRAKIDTHKLERSKPFHPTQRIVPDKKANSAFRCADMSLNLRLGKFFRQNCRNTNKSWILGRDDKGRHLRQVIREAALLFEAGAEAGMVEARAQFRHDAAADVDAALSAQRDGDVGGDRGQHAAEGFDNVVAQLTLA